MDHQAEELGKKRRQDEVAKARVMLEGVSEGERREMIAMFPELRVSKSAEQRLNYFDDADEDVLPKAYVFMGPELVCATGLHLAQCHPSLVQSHSAPHCSRQTFPLASVPHCLDECAVALPDSRIQQLLSQGCRAVLNVQVRDATRRRRL